MPTVNPTLTHSIPMPEECFVHLTYTLRRFGNVPTFLANGFNVRCSDLSLERVVRLNGRRPFVCRVRTSPRFVRNLTAPPEGAGEASSFDRLVLEYARRVTAQTFGVMAPGDFLSLVDPSEELPDRAANVVCRVLSGASLIEIQFWFGEDLSPF